MRGDPVLTPRLLDCAAIVRKRFPKRIGTAVVVDVERLAQAVCASLEEYPLTGSVLGCTVFVDGRGHTAIREGLRRQDPARWQFTLAHETAEIVLHRYLDALPDQCRRERVCDAFAAELLLPAQVVDSSVGIMSAVCGGPRNINLVQAEQLAHQFSRTYGVSVTMARISISQSLAEAA
ncbi:MAG: ImmA/IrrE family metallo-endopeptidase [Candidatus Cryosericum sp.]